MNDCRQHGARTDAGPLQPLEPGWQRLPFGVRRVVAPPDVGEHPVGAGDVEREAQDAVLAGLCAGAQGHQAGRRGGREGAGELAEPPDGDRRARRRAAAHRRPTRAAGASPGRRPARPRRDRPGRPPSARPSLSTAPGDPEQRGGGGQHVADRTGHWISLGSVWHDRAPAVGWSPAAGGRCCRPARGPAAAAAGRTAGPSAPRPRRRRPRRAPRCSRRPRRRARAPRFGQRERLTVPDQPLAHTSTSSPARETTVPQVIRQLSSTLSGCSSMPRPRNRVHGIHAEHVEAVIAGGLACQVRREMRPVAARLRADDRQQRVEEVLRASSSAPTPPPSQYDSTSR